MVFQCWSPSKTKYWEVAITSRKIQEPNKLFFTLVHFCLRKMMSLQLPFKSNKEIPNEKQTSFDIFCRFLDLHMMVIVLTLKNVAIKLTVEFKTNLTCSLNMSVCLTQYTICKISFHHHVKLSFGDDLTLDYSNNSVHLQFSSLFNMPITSIYMDCVNVAYWLLFACHQLTAKIL